ncbi:MAG: hypothetical protein QHH04_08305 [Methanolinea sp.]|nr:hypothetical protein [Methanolinea sp.]
MCPDRKAPAKAFPELRRVVLFIAIISSFITPFDGSAVNIALPAIGEEFSLDAITLPWITTSYLLTISKWWGRCGCSGRCFRWASQ